MNSIFENVFIADRHTVDLISIITEELSVLPHKLLKFCFEHGGKIHVCEANNTLFFARNGLEIYTNDDGRTSLENSHVYLYSESSRIDFVFVANGTDFLKNGYPHSVAIHEFFHLIDYVLCLENSKKRLHFLSDDLPEGKPLDWYADLNQWEKFAVSGEAFCHRERFVSDDYRTHNKLELHQKSPEIFGYFDEFFKQWK